MTYSGSMELVDIIQAFGSHTLPFFIGSVIFVSVTTLYKAMTRKEPR